MGTTPFIGRDGIIDIDRSKDPASLQVSPYGGPLTNNIFVEKIDGEGSGINVYCYCWNSMLGIEITQTSYNYFVSSCFLSQELEGTLDNQKELLGIFKG